MPFQVSPGVNVSEIDLTTVVPAVSSTEGAIAGVFRWGPVSQPILIDSENALVNRFGKPSSFNAETFFTSANFLSYGNKLYVSRAAVTTANTSNVVTSNTSAYILSSATSPSISSVGIDFTTKNLSAGDLVFVTTNGTSTYRSVVSVASNALVLDANVGLTANQTAFGTVSRVVSTTVSAFANVAPITDPWSIYVRDSEDYRSKVFDSSVLYVARHPGKYGSSLKVAICDSESAFQSSHILNTSSVVATGTLVVPTRSESGQLTMVATGNTVTNTQLIAALSDVTGKLQPGDWVTVTNDEGGKQDVKIKTIGTAAVTLGALSVPQVTVDLTFVSKYTLPVAGSVTTLTRKWEFYQIVDGAPGQSEFQAVNGSDVNDELHVVIVDEDGDFATAGTILEVYQAVSRSLGSKTASGGTNYYKNVINQSSKYVWFANDRSGAASAEPLQLAGSSNLVPLALSFFGGRDGNDEGGIAIGALTTAYDVFADTERVDVSLILQGKTRGSGQLANYLIDNIAEQRKDCVVFISPNYDNVVNNGGNESADVVAFRNELRSSSYAVLDSGYKYQYDKYSDVYRYIPLNGDTAGLCVRTDSIRDPWFSPAGFNRGQIKNIIRLAYNPQKADRDILYKAGVNPVVTFPGQGTVLYGDKTLLSKPSAFDRINVRRLFIVLEKAIATAAKFTLFEFNDQFTRARFVGLVEPFLRDVQGRRGIYDFKVVCDETNNTGEVIDRNEFMGDIYIKPARSINFIQLNFVAVRTGVEFSEVVGQF